MGAQSEQPDFEHLEDRVVAAFPRLTAKQRQIARVLLEEHLYSAFASAEDLGRRAGVDAATVVRFSQMLGFSGWVELREILRDGVPGLLTAAEKVSTVSGHPRDTSEVMAEILAHDTRNIQQTAILNTPGTVAKAVQAILHARTVFVIGLGLEAYIADTLHLQLQRTGIPVRRVPTSLATAALELATAGEGDVVIGVALWRYVADTVRMFEEGTGTGARGIALTDSKLAPVARAAEIVLLAADSAPRLSHSMTGMLSMVNMLASSVTLAAPERALHHLEHVDGMLRDLDVLSE